MRNLRGIGIEKGLDKNFPLGEMGRTSRVIMAVIDSNLWYVSAPHLGDHMGAFLGLGVGAAIGLFGFMVMRNPYVLARLAPGSEGYYQRLVLDTLQRNQLRLLGVLVSLFGGTISISRLNPEITQDRRHLRRVSCADGFAVFRLLDSKLVYRRLAVVSGAASRLVEDVASRCAAWSNRNVTTCDAQDAEGSDVLYLCVLRPSLPSDCGWHAPLSRLLAINPVITSSPAD